MNFSTIKWIAAIGVLMSAFGLAVLVFAVFHVKLYLPIGVLAGFFSAKIIFTKQPSN